MPFAHSACRTRQIRRAKFRKDSEVQHCLSQGAFIQRVPLKKLNLVFDLQQARKHRSANQSSVISWLTPPTFSSRPHPSLCKMIAVDVACDDEQVRNLTLNPPSPLPLLYTILVRMRVQVAFLSIFCQYLRAAFLKGWVMNRLASNCTEIFVHHTKFDKACCSQQLIDAICEILGFHNFFALTFITWNDRKFTRKNGRHF